jgi:riboflavin transporter FmnP
VRPPIQEPLATHMQQCYVCLFSQTQERNTTDIIHICIYQSRTTTYVPYKVQQFGPSICYITQTCFTSTGHQSWLSICLNFLYFSPLYEKITFRPLKNILVFGAKSCGAEVTQLGATYLGAEVRLLLATTG